MMRRLNDRGPKGEPGFDFTPEAWFWPPVKPWNYGMMEKWNIGVQKRMMVGLNFLILVIHNIPGHRYKKDQIPPTQYSSIPIFHHSTA